MGKKTAELEAKKEDSQKGLQERYIKAQMLEQQMRQLQKYLETFDQQLDEIKKLVGAMKDFSELRTGEKILAPIANGIFVKAKLEDAGEVLVNVGNNVVVAKSIEGAVKLLEAQESEVTHYKTEVMAQLEAMMKEIDNLQEE